MLYMKKFLSLLLVLGLLGSSQAALAAEESPAPLPGWSHSILATAIPWACSGTRSASSTARL